MIVTCNHQTLDLSKPKDADAFLAAMHDSYGEAAQCEWAKEFEFAKRTLSVATYDQSRSKTSFGTLKGAR